MLDTGDEHIEKVSNSLAVHVKQQKRKFMSIAVSGYGGAMAPPSFPHLINLVTEGSTSSLVPAAETSDHGANGDKGQCRRGAVGGGGARRIETGGRGSSGGL